ncbi:Uu.00g115700.m01.CDS01 [Anthostomella pinea]|uniref:DASH complex subunit SPC19 n=1 Tax=Anthostomella pinea TaxID=933095 RepID=A0AAI8VGE4_9PEZI|nr:Uu.00g115700.m01.CDS01 [Anthostomella pinea]
MATTTTTSGNTSSYSDCVTALRTSLSFLESSVSTLGNGVSDFPRLVNVLKTVRHYELIPQPTLAAAEASLRDEIGPATALLLDRADAHIDRVERRIDSLKARSELQQGRLQQDSSISTYSKGKGNAKNMKENVKPGRSLEGSAKLRARVVRQRREALQYSVERLELEVLQKERELRKRLGEAA